MAATIRVFFHSPTVLAISFEGHIQGTSLAFLPSKIDAVLAGTSVRRVFFDTEAVTGYSIDVRGPGATMLAHLRTKGIERAVVFAPLASVRMIGSALLLAAGLPATFVATRIEAITTLATDRTP